LLPVRSISLFSGAGGLDLATEGAGFQTVAAVESNGTARATLLANAPRFFDGLIPDRVFDDVLDVEGHDLLEAAGLDIGEVDLLVGGPPCTPFSKSGYWLAYKRAGEDPKANLLDEYVRVLAAVRPKAFLMENVYGLAYRNQNRAVLNRFLDGVRRAGYCVDYRILLAADYGVPQRRQRLFCVGLRNDLVAGPHDLWRFEWPLPTHAGPHETRKGWDTSLAPHVSVSEALAGLDNNPTEPEEIVAGTYAAELAAVPPGDNYLWWTAHRGHPHPRFEWRSRYWNFLLKLHPERPSPTIQGQPGPWVGPFHWDSRRLRVNELKRLMAFPDDFTVLGTRREQQLQLGNAVPPLLGEIVARSIAGELERAGAAAPALLAA
jgi:DNA (cytosine-5)-methyltransferase 1